MNFPKVVRIEPAAKCNLACSHCPTGTVDMPRGLMNEEVFNKIFDQLKKNLEFIKVIVLYHGGEPLLNKKFFIMSSSIRNLSNNIKIKTVTNGMTLTVKNSHKLVECGLNEIEISLDGSSPNESEEVRINSKTSKIIENINKLIEIRDYKKSDLNIYLTTTQFLRSKVEVENPEKLVAKTPTWIKDLFGNNVKYKSNLAMKWPHMKVGNQYELARANGLDKNYCDHPINTISIRSNGDIVPCCYDITSQMVMGNIMNDTIIDIFNGSKYTNLRDSIFKKKYISACKNCNVVRPSIYLVKSN